MKRGRLLAKPSDKVSGGIGNKFEIGYHQIRHGISATIRVRTLPDQVSASVCKIAANQREAAAGRRTQCAVDEKCVVGIVIND